MRNRVTMHTRTGKTIRYRAKETEVVHRAGRIVEWKSDGIKGARLLVIGPEDLVAVIVRPWWRLR